MLAHCASHLVAAFILLNRLFASGTRLCVLVNPIEGFFLFNFGFKFFASFNFYHFHLLLSKLSCEGARGRVVIKITALKTSFCSTLAQSLIFVFVKLKERVALVIFTV